MFTIRRARHLPVKDARHPHTYRRPRLAMLADRITTAILAERPAQVLAFASVVWLIALARSTSAYQAWTTLPWLAQALAVIVPGALACGYLDTLIKRYANGLHIRITLNWNRTLTSGDAHWTDPENEPIPYQPVTIVLPSTITNAALWRERVRTLLAAAGAEGMGYGELCDALRNNYRIRVDTGRLNAWLRTDPAIGRTFGDSVYFYLPTGETQDNEDATAPQVDLTDLDTDTTSATGTGAVMAGAARQ